MTPPRQGCQRGDVVLVLSPHSDLHTAKTRPALVVQADHLQTGVPQVVVAMISSQMAPAASQLSAPNLVMTQLPANLEPSLFNEGKTSGFRSAAMHGHAGRFNH